MRESIVGIPETQRIFAHWHTAHDREAEARAELRWMQRIRAEYGGAEDAPRRLLERMDARIGALGAEAEACRAYYERLERAIGYLSEVERRLLRMNCWDGILQVDAAGMAGMTQDMAKSYIAFAKKAVTVAVLAMEDMEPTGYRITAEAPETAGEAAREKGQLDRSGARCYIGDLLWLWGDAPEAMRRLAEQRMGWCADPERVDTALEWYLVAYDAIDQAIGDTRSPSMRGVLRPMYRDGMRVRQAADRAGYSDKTMWRLQAWYRDQLQPRLPGWLPAFVSWRASLPMAWNRGKREPLRGFDLPETGRERRYVVEYREIARLLADPAYGDALTVERLTARTPPRAPAGR